MPHAIEPSPPQRRAISHNKGHLRIIACPGSGKTETVSRRVAELVRNGTKPSSIVAFTFTVKAAEELKHRIRGLLESENGRAHNFGDMYVGTIDAFCLYMLKKLRPEYRNFEVLDEAKRMAFTSRWYSHLGLERIDRTGKWNTIRKFHASVDILAMEKIDPSHLTDRNFAACHEMYAERLKEERFFDFVSIIRTLLDVLYDDKDALDHMGDEIRHVVMDEYQDVNLLQEELLGMLSRRSDSVCVVGDDDQNIYQWRGSDISYILDFPEKYKKYGVTKETLDTNYRATDALVDMATQFISNNATRVGKDMRYYAGQPNRFEPGDMVHRHFATDKEEFDYVCGAMKDLLGTKFATKSGETRPISYMDMAVLVRTNEDAARIMKMLEAQGIPCIADSGTDIFGRPIVSLAVNCIMHAFGFPGYKMDDVPDTPYLEAEYSEAVSSGDAALFRDGMREVGSIAMEIKAKRRDWLPGLGLQEFYHRILAAMGSERGVFTDADMYNLAVVSRTVFDYEYVYGNLRARDVGGLKWFIEQFAVKGYPDPLHNNPSLDDAVRVMTIWKAKGLEFPAVFVPSFDSRRTPPPQDLYIDKNLYPCDRYDGKDEDDRRAYYVAVTRAQKYLFLTGAEKITIGVTQDPPKTTRGPHRFVQEIKNPHFTDCHVKKPVFEGEGQAAEGRRLSSTYSALSVYGRCPYDYHLRHVMGFNEAVPPEFTYGSNIHGILNRIHTEYVRKGTIPDEAGISGLFEEMFHMRFAPKYLVDNMRKAGTKMVARYVEKYKGDFGGVVDAEKRFEFRLDGALISGLIDLVTRSEGGMMITEFKTSGRERDTVYGLDYGEQARFYAHAAMASFGYRPDAAAVHYLGEQRVEYVDVGDGALGYIKNEMAGRIMGIREGRFKPAPEDKKCRRCDFRAVCSFKGFEVGPGFDTLSPDGRGDPGTGDVGSRTGSGTAMLPPVVSKGMMEKANKLAVHVRHISGSRYEVPSSSDPGKIYVVDGSRCRCRGFTNYPNRHPGTIPTCSHVEAAKIFSKPGG